MKTYKKLIAILSALAICVCMTTTTVFAIDNSSNSINSTRNTVVGSVVLSSANYNGNPIPTGANKSFTLSGKPKVLGYIALPQKVGSQNSLNVTFTQGINSRTVTLTAGAGYQEIDISSWGFQSGGATIKLQSTTKPVISISVTFGT